MAQTFKDLWAYETKDMRPSLPGSYTVINGVPTLTAYAPSNLSYQQPRANATGRTTSKLSKPKNTTPTPSIDTLLTTLSEIVAPGVAGKMEDSAWETKRRETYARYRSCFK